MADETLKIISRFETKLDIISQDLTDLKIKLATMGAQKENQEKMCELHSIKVTEHETRISCLEKNMYKAMGAIAVANIVISLAVSHFLKI